MKGLRVMVLSGLCLVGPVQAEMGFFARIEAFVSAFAYMLQALKATGEAIGPNKLEDVPCVRCSSCKQTELGIKLITIFLTNKVLDDIRDGKDTFRQIKIHIDECLAVSREGKQEVIADFIFRISNVLGYICTSCTGTTWEMIPR